MKVNEEDMQTIWFDKKSESVRIIDQTLLPFKLKIKDFIDKGFQRSKIFTWEKCASETLKVYKKITN